ncbi:MAG: hypothetical protein M9947_06460 [Thermomicrobiales bacterium]|nr:hypothetical protein [Thermomicrobiales bacterium]
MSWFRETMLKAEAKADELENWIKDTATSAVDRTRSTVDDTVERTGEFASDYEANTESALNRLSGYAGYKSKERARDSDRALRDDIARQLNQDAGRVESIQRAAADVRNTQRVNELEPVVQGFRNAANLVQSLSYGYGGLFSDKPVDDIALRQLRLFDNGLMLKATALSSGVAGIEAGDANAAADVQLQIASFRSSLQLRNDVITEGRPANPVKTRISPATEKAFADEDAKKTEPIELPNVSIGDAMSILGDDHLVEALIDVDTGTSTERFIRLDNKPQMWLWVSTDATHTPHRLLATDEPTGVSWSETAGRARITVPDERTRSGPATIRTGRTVDSGVVQLDIDGAVQNFTASDVHLDDIETYQAK